MTDPLRCAEVRELAPEVALGIAPAQDRARVLWHATACAACREVLSELSAVADDVLALAREHEPPAGFETQVLARIGDRSPRRRRRRWRRVALFAAAIAREKHPVGWRVAGTGHLPAKHGELVAQDRDLQVFGVRGWAQANQGEDLPDDRESQGAHHHGLILVGPCNAWSQP